MNTCQEIKQKLSTIYKIVLIPVIITLDVWITTLSLAIKIINNRTFYIIKVLIFFHNPGISKNNSNYLSI